MSAGPSSSSSTSLPRNFLIVEPFYGGSHKSFIESITQCVSKYTLVTLAPKKWQWRARCGALMLHDVIPVVTTEEYMFCSSVFNLAELLGLRPDLAKLKKIVYFHENQLIYPVQKIKERDVQYAYNQIITCMAADLILFNSQFNLSSFLANIPRILKMIPECTAPTLVPKIQKKSQVLYFPIDLPVVPTTQRGDILHIVWPHRWEFDKNPEDFFQTVYKLKEKNIPFMLSILGESFSKVPPVFLSFRPLLANEIVNYGYVSREDYFRILRSCHVVVSTADHEFFGVAMMEAVFCGCFPLAPNKLVYPELYPAHCLYKNLNDLYERLEGFCKNTNSVFTARTELQFNLKRYTKGVFVKRFNRFITEGLRN